MSSTFTAKSTTEGRGAQRVKNRNKKSGATAARMVIAVGATAVAIAPIYWMISTAFKTGNQAFAANPVLIFVPTLENFRQVLVGSDFGYAILNSLQVSILSSLFAVVLGSGIAYPLARFPRPRDKHLKTWIISLRIVPPIVTIIPLFLMMQTVGLNGTLVSIIILHTFMNLPLAVWLLQGFYADVPKEIEESAHIDGLGHLGSFFRIVLPLAMPGVVSTALLSFVFSWNEFLFANILSSANARTATVALTEFTTPVGTDWTRIMAAGVVVAIPVWIAALAAQKYLVRGLSFGAVK